MVMLFLYDITSLFLLILVTCTNIPSCYSYLFEGKSVNCEGAYNCGNIHGVNYPFWGGGSRSRLCGNDNLYLQCEDNQTTLSVPYFIRNNIGYKPSEFHVLMINQSSYRMKIVHHNHWKNVCPESSSLYSLYKYNTTLIIGLRYVQGTRFINIHYGCSPEVLSTVQVQSNFSCFIIGTINTGVFFTDEIVTNVLGCSFSILVPLVSTAYNKLWDATITLQEAVNEGFEVDYSDALGGCLACQDSGGICELSLEFRCRCGDTTHPSTCPDNAKLPAYLVAQPNTDFSRKIHSFKLTIGLSVAGIGILICFGIWYTQYRKSFNKCIGFINGKTEDQSLEALLKQYGSLAPRRYSYWEIKKMTNRFKDKLGEGGFGGVYKGELSDGRAVAVKILKASKGDGEEFINEVASISQTSHVNIVSLLGYCLDGSKRALIYDFMPNGSLEKYIYGDGSPLGLNKLYQIAVGIAKGLEYLHRGCNTRILHFDIKPHNILLDEEFCPKISDFGLAKLCTRKESIVSMLGARGTIGYIAPEVISRSFGGVSHKSDVYSYGMMVLEMVGGRKNVNEEVSHTSEIYFPYWAYQHVQLDDDLKLHGIIDIEEEETARKMILVGLWCIQTDPAQRPSMSKVIDMLEGSLVLEIPPKPLLCTPYCSGRHSFNTQAMPLNAFVISSSSSSLCSTEESANFIGTATKDGTFQK
ncbi:LEAF RUST 10 DISEASE-RESISTANCE LOCUS RECEPTOR-LIKE PROTEIN KINASE-like 2.4 [Solanum stenotomum]|uniref:LEAF RUST 10 DISEASE-RESISTANCE LOCUS RECEPTOR-LIKE PROTEIN KINASE-like 2.4 n=1 Tax=Solanum stenotomum TaxID=172797 RepID=UPI0020D0CDF0|nr:LEAF RUST 10 DISEASE-RESISTANCE LOCUS RECEPTOR-LIKE PROTEIN KINASE-like 2.4 [Solanum stenotomum]XP_049399201.1 LEAF RUST 10 DISEASE-RESISTANCE LOCUS RECEPTOR-LIKE PROTEIN KINASE-like 2.4 [Solanum stenotomum]